jgi:hypothetical protein
MPNYVTIESQINAVDNLNDPVPSWNRPATILGTTLAFSVRPQQSFRAWLYPLIQDFDRP